MVQFNDEGLFNGDSGLVYNKTTNTLTTDNLASGGVKVGTISGVLKGTTGVISAATAGTDYISPNTPITGGTKTKITYDSKGLITAGVDATQDDISDGTTNRSYTNTEKTKLAGIEANANNYIHPNHTGEVTSTGGGATVIGANVVTNSKLATMTTKTYKGRTSVITGNPEDIAVATLKADLLLTKADVGLGSVDNTSDINKPISSATQTALNLKQNTSEKNTANGYAGLDADSKINPSQLPALAVTDTFVVATEVAMLALTAEVGDVAVRTDLNKTFILKVSPPTVLANWQELLSPTDTVQSVFGRTGAVTAQINDYTWGQINKTISNLSDLTTKSHTSLTDIGTNAHSQIDTHINNTLNPHSVTKSQVGLGNVTDNAQYYSGGTDVAIIDGGTGQSTAQLAINALTNVGSAANEYVLTKDTITGDATFKASQGGGGGGTPGGSDTQVQFNDGGLFGGDVGLLYNKTTKGLNVAGNILAGDVYSYSANSGIGINRTINNPNGYAFALNILGDVTATTTAYSMWMNPTLSGNSVAGFYAGATINTTPRTVNTAYGGYIAPMTRIGTGIIGEVYGFYIANQTQGNANYSWNLYVAGSRKNYIGGNIGIGVGASTANLHIRAGTATANTAPIKLNTGVLNTTPEAGAIEFDGTNLYFVNSSGVRKQLAVV